MDPTTLALVGTSLLSGLFGGGDGPEPQRRQLFGRNHPLTHPEEALNRAITTILRMGQGMSETPGVRLRSSYVQPSPGPVSIPGLPFQIGGGLGRDPALDNPDLLAARNPGDTWSQYDPFQSEPLAGIDAIRQSRQPVRRREP